MLHCLSSNPPALGRFSKGSPLDRLKNFTSELSVPSLNLTSPLAQLDLIETTLKDVLDKREQHDVNRLIVAGGSLESEVTILSMTGLALGFDVYVLGDMLVSSGDSYNNLYWNRLIQAGVVPTTMIQMIAEWIASENDKANGSDIKLVAEKFGLTGKV